MTAHLLFLVRHGEAQPSAAEDDVGLSATGRRQVALLGERLAGLPFTSIGHGPLARAAETAALLGRHLPGVPLAGSDALGDYVPYVPPTPTAWSGFFDGYTADEVAQGAALAATAIDRHAGPGTGQDTCELIVTHGFLIAWFVRHALDAPPARWLGLNACNAALTVIRYSTQRPPALVLFNDMAHLPPELRWTGFPPDRRL